MGSLSLYVERTKKGHVIVQSLILVDEQQVKIVLKRDSVMFLKQMVRILKTLNKEVTYLKMKIWNLY